MSQCDELLCNDGVGWKSDEDNGAAMICVVTDSSSQKKPIETSCDEEHVVAMNFDEAMLEVDGAAMCRIVVNSSLCAPLYGLCELG